MVKEELEVWVSVYRRDRWRGMVDVGHSRDVLRQLKTSNMSGGG
jgi:hypothetical protein